MSKTITNPIEYAREIVGKDPMAVFLGITVEEVRQGFARCSLTIAPHYLNVVKRAHGVSVHAVADQAFAVAANSLGHSAIALHFTISYTAGALVGETIVAEASPLHVGKKVSVWRVEVKGHDKRLIATCEGIAYHK